MSAARQAPGAYACCIASPDIERTFVKVIPVEYRRVLRIVAQEERSGLAHEAALERAFEIITAPAAPGAHAPTCKHNATKEA